MIDSFIPRYTYMKVTLEFYERKKGQWLLPAETVNWEVWHLMVTIIEPGNEQGGGKEEHERKGERGTRI